jgi:hypothetical protein
MLDKTNSTQHAPHNMLYTTRLIQHNSHMRLTEHASHNCHLTEYTSHYSHLTKHRRCGYRRLVDQPVILAGRHPGLAAGDIRLGVIFCCPREHSHFSRDHLAVSPLPLAAAELSIDPNISPRVQVCGKCVIFNIYLKGIPFLNNRK